MKRKYDNVTVKNWWLDVERLKLAISDISEMLDNNAELPVYWKKEKDNKEAELDSLEEAIIESKNPRYNTLCACDKDSKYRLEHAEAVLYSKNIDYNYRIMRLNIPGIDYIKHANIVLNSNDRNEIVRLRNLTLASTTITETERDTVVEMCNERIKELKLIKEK